MQEIIQEEGILGGFSGEGLKVGMKHLDICMGAIPEGVTHMKAFYMFYEYNGFTAVMH